ncbi:N-acyl-D-amino-acid deacylase family protein [Gloeobacter morelensis]|uniref:D-aminoacylase n=1 Tax=Gloeobacter morelensis MG652769 TaxID=2781736 RepID=A0ABY3PJT6_9CYAN|nr:D-aminoacylase [Gloeobacter morelensis]UFP93907.1 D-aminoacylase [Gloeobacter morelensis MG652769]
MEKIVGIGTLLLLGAVPVWAEDVLITNALIYDGGGGAPFAGSVRVEAGRIAAVAPALSVRPGERTRNLGGLTIAPGFIDMHSHADGAIFENPTADAAIRQGIATVFVGQDGESNYPLANFFARLDQQPAALNVASMVGHATLRREAMKPDALRASTPLELARMRTLLAQEMAVGAFGLSTGLEYPDGFSATTEEVVELANVVAPLGGFYISHMRDEGNAVFEAMAELVDIGAQAGLPVQISHIKLSTTPVWHQATVRVPQLIAAARRRGVDLKADVYPYTFWQSTLRVIVPDRDYFNAAKVEKAIADNGGPERLRIVRYGPQPALAGKTLDQIARLWKVTPTQAFMRIVRETEPVGGGQPAEGVIGTSVSEDDLRTFIAAPWTMFCTDGELNGAHPRGAGSFARILGKYVREEKVLPLAAAIYKMTALPASRLKLTDRGRIAPGFHADLVVFDPARVADRATVEAPLAPPVGIEAVMVNGEWVVDRGQVTGKRPGRVLRRPGS